MENAEHKSPPLQPESMPPVPPRSNPLTLKMIVMGVVLVGLGLLGGYFLFSPKSVQQNINQTAQVTPTAMPQKEMAVNPASELNDFPIYQGASYVNKVTKDPCTGNESGFSQCGSTVYTWQTNDDFNTVNTWYMSDKAQSGWKCNGGAGAVGGPRDATTTTTCIKNGLSYSLNLSANATTTTITIAVPTKSQAADTASWKTYTGNGFIFKYSSMWSVNSKNPTQLIASMSTTQKAAGDYTPGMAWLDVMTTSDSVNKIISQTAGIDKKEQITLNGVQATKLSGMTGVAGSVYYVTILTNNNGKTYELNFSTQDPKLLAAYNADLAQMLSTFKFTK